MNDPQGTEPQEPAPERQQPGGPGSHPPDPGQPGPRSFSTGFAWLNSAASLLRSQAPRLLLLGLLLQMIGGLSQAGGPLAFLFIIAVPALTAGMLQGMHVAAGGERPGPFTVFAAFAGGGRLLPLLLLGLISIGATLMVLFFLVASTLSGLDPELAARIQAGDQTAVLELDPAIAQKVLFGTVTGLLVGACLSLFAVPLIWFGGRPVGAALWLGVATLFRQWRALTALGIGLAAVGLPVGLLAGMLMAFQLSGAGPSFLTTLVLLLILVVYQVYAFAAQYVAYRDLFMAPMGDGGEMAPRDEGPPSGDGGGDDQLVA
ncbi:MAG: hypothetical protein V2I57_07235 [Xanthomonadales bacterium]|jgi:hypothetical protein|nr:hypothetical protein [Xanthomonadales bacterium]